MNEKIELKAKQVYAMSDVKVSIEVIGETDKAINANIHAEFLDMDTEYFANGSDIWIPKSIIAKKQDKAKIEWIFANKDRQLYKDTKEVPTLDQLYAGVDEIERVHGGVNEDEFTLQMRGLRPMAAEAESN